MMVMRFLSQELNRVSRQYIARVEDELTVFLEGGLCRLFFGKIKSFMVSVDVSGVAVTAEERSHQTPRVEGDDRDHQLRDALVTCVISPLSAVWEPLLSKQCLHQLVLRLCVLMNDFILQVTRGLYYYLAAASCILLSVCV